MDDYYKVDNSMLSTFASCSLGGVVRYVLGLTAKAAKVAADAGNFAHKVFKGHFEGRSGKDVLAEFVSGYGDYVAANPEKIEDRLGLENLRDILEEWMVRHPLEKFQFEIVEAEKVRMAILSEEEKIMFFGKMDAVVREKATGLLAPLDHKTTGKVTSWWMKQFRLGSQMTGYIWLARKLFPGEEISRAYINAVEFSKLPSSDRKCSAHSTSVEKVTYNQCKKQHAKWELLVTSREEEAIEEWELTAMFLARRLKELSEKITGIELVKYVRRQGAFTKGCTFCEFDAFCLEGCTKEAAERLLVEDRWEPWKEGEDAV